MVRSSLRSSSAQRSTAMASNTVAGSRPTSSAVGDGRTLGHEVEGLGRAEEPRVDEIAGHLRPSPEIEPERPHLPVAHGPGYLAGDAHVVER